MDFRQQNPCFAARKQQSQRLLRIYPSKTPVIIQPLTHQSPHLTQTRFLIPRQYTFHQLLFHLRKRLKLPSSRSIYLLINNKLPQMTKNLQQIYQQHHDQDGFLYISYSSEQAWGCN